jgi:hypothetical protein
LIKGDGQYRVTKGFIDLIVHCSGFKNRFFHKHQSGYGREFVIEIKKEDDFNDFGSILRQINEYKKYYNKYVCGLWTSKIIKSDNNRRDIQYFVILSTKIPDKIKTFLHEQGLLTIELDGKGLGGYQ